MKNRRNYYRILHVQPDAPTEVIKSSYRTLMLRLKQHPDLGGDYWNSQLIIEAKNILTDPKKRSQYDRELQLSRSKAALSERFHYQQQDNSARKDDPGERKNTEKKPCCVFCKKPHNQGALPEPGAKCSQCGSPMNPVQKIGSKKSDHRSVTRIKNKAGITFYTHWPQKRGYQGQVRDLSPHGMQFLAHQLIPDNQVIRIQNSLLHATARVVSCSKLHHSEPGKPDCHVIGTEFCTLQFQQESGTFVSVKA